MLRLSQEHTRNGDAPQRQKEKVQIAKSKAYLDLESILKQQVKVFQLHY